MVRILQKSLKPISGEAGSREHSRKDFSSEYPQLCSAYVSKFKSSREEWRKKIPGKSTTPQFDRSKTIRSSRHRGHSTPKTATFGVDLQQLSTKVVRRYVRIRLQNRSFAYVQYLRCSRNKSNKLTTYTKQKNIECNIIYVHSFSFMKFRRPFTNMVFILKINLLL